MPLNLVLLKSCQVVGVLWGAWVARDPAAFAPQVEQLLALYLAGRIRPRISNRYPLERGAEAIRDLADRQAMGKIVLTVG
jgi:NADPH2:quinone reductase